MEASHGSNLCFADWTVPDPNAVEELEWRLRYQDGELSKADRLRAASIVGAYCGLLGVGVLTVDEQMAKLRKVVVAVRAEARRRKREDGR